MLKYHMYLYYVLHMMRMQPNVGSRQVNRHSTVSLMMYCGEKMITLWGIECVQEAHLKPPILLVYVYGWEGD